MKKLLVNTTKNKNIVLYEYLMKPNEDKSANIAIGDCLNYATLVSKRANYWSLVIGRNVSYNKVVVAYK